MTYEEFYKEQYPVLLKAEEQLKNLITQFETNENKKKIAYCSSTIKSPESMKQKLLKKGEEPNTENAVSKVNDAVGIRVITSFVDDIYKVSDWITLQNDIEVVNIKDYIAYPKPNGYRSYHMIVEIPVFFTEGKFPMRAEIQIRTIGMDFWASVDHQLRYKKTIGADKDIEAIEAELLKCAQTVSETDCHMEEIKDMIGDFEKI